MKVLTVNSPKYGKHQILIDYADWDLVKRHTWHVYPHGYTFYAATHIKNPDGKRTTIKMHQLLVPQAISRDHINGNGLDNRRSNIRACTQQQNQCNRRKHKKCSSKFKGVCWRDTHKKWVASIRHDGKLKHLGYFTDEYEAALAYDKAAIEKHGSYAKPNFSQNVNPDTGYSTVDMVKSIIWRHKNPRPISVQVQECFNHSVVFNN